MKGGIDGYPVGVDYHLAEVPAEGIALKWKALAGTCFHLPPEAAKIGS